MPDSLSKTNSASPWLLLLFLFVIFGLCARFITIAWPGNPESARLYAPELKRRAILLATEVSRADVERAVATLASLPNDPKASTITAGAIDHLHKQIDVATALGAGARPENLSNDPLQWTSKQFGEVKAMFGTAQAKLQARSDALRGPLASPGFWRILLPWRSPVSPIDPQPPLNAAETTRYTSALVDLEVKDPPHLFGSIELELLALFAALGAAGGAAQALSSLAYHKGRRQFSSSWVMYYLTRPLIGAALGPTFYIVLRGTLVNGQNTGLADLKSLNLFGYAAVATLVGFFSGEAMENLKSIAEGLFGEKPRLLDTTKPVVLKVTPELVDDAIRLNVVGQNFTPSVQVHVDGNPAAATKFVSEMLLIATARGLKAGTHELRVVSPDTHVGASDAITLLVPSAAPATGA